MLKDMMQNPIARTNVISPVMNESGGNQVSFKKQNQSIMDNSLEEGEENENEDEEEILTHRTTMIKSFSTPANTAKETRKQKDRRNTLVRLGIRDEADLLKGNMQCVKMLIIQDFIIVVCKHLKLMV